MKPSQKAKQYTDKDFFSLYGCLKPYAKKTKVNLLIKLLKKKQRLSIKQSLIIMPKKWACLKNRKVPLTTFDRKLAQISKSL